MRYRSRNYETYKCLGQFKLRPRNCRWSFQIVLPPMHSYSTVFRFERRDLFDLKNDLLGQVDREESSLHSIEVQMMKRLCETCLSDLDAEELIATFYEVRFPIWKN